jgi:Tfp pilus assembly pilus retraction ATPase PilT
MVYDIMNDGQRKHYEENLECDFSFAIPNLARFRVNAFVQNRGAGAVFPDHSVEGADAGGAQLPEDLQGDRRSIRAAWCW